MGRGLLLGWWYGGGPSRLCVNVLLTEDRSDVMLIKLLRWLPTEVASRVSSAAWRHAEMMVLCAHTLCKMVIRMAVG